MFHEDWTADINPELKTATPLSISETLQILEQSKVEFTNDKRVPPETFVRMFEHVSQFARFRTQAQARESRATLKHLEQYGVSENHQVQLANLTPATAEEAKALMGRALDRIPDDELQRVLNQLASCVRIKAEAGDAE